jgi:hypothetical protein
VSRLADAPAAQARRRALRFGGVEGNELLTSSVAALLTILLVAEGVTIIHLDGLLSTHMFIGLALIPPVLLKLASTGYRFMRYYTGSPAYRANGPPLMLLRVLAPILVASTAMIFVTGVWRLLLGHRSDEVLMLHKVGFIVWGGAFGVHFLAHLPQAGRSLGAAWGSSARRRRGSRRDGRRHLTGRRDRARARAALTHRRPTPSPHRRPRREHRARRPRALPARRDRQWSGFAQRVRTVVNGVRLGRRSSAPPSSSPTHDCSPC